MTPITYAPLYISVYFLLLSAAMAASSVSGSLFDQFIGLVFWGAVYCVGLFCGLQNAKQKKPLYAQITNGVLIIALLVFLITVATQDLIRGLALFLLWIQAAQNFSLSTRRDLYFAFAVSFFLLMYGAAMSKSSGFLLYMVVYVLAGTFTLVAAHLDMLINKSKTQGASIEKNVTGLSGGITVLSAGIIIMATLLYLFVPRPAALHFGAFATAGGNFYKNSDWEQQAKSGTSSEQDLLEEINEDKDANNPGEGGDIESSGEADGSAEGYAKGHAEGGAGQQARQQARDGFRYHGFDRSFDIDQARSGKQLGNELLMYVDSPRPLYLRGPVYDRFDNNRWSKRLKRDNKFKLKLGEIDFGKQPQDLLIHTITLEETITSTIFAAEEVKSLNFPGSVIARDSYGAMTSPQRIRKGTVYSVKSKMSGINGRLISDSRPLVTKAPYLQLPDSFNKDIHKLARSVSQSQNDDLSRSDSIEQYLRNNYDYTFDTIGSSTNGVLIDEFLFNSKRGHCELFATSMVLMLRSIGIPARLATGFSATNMNPVTGYYEVRGLDAHAWVEAYIDNAGWVMFEPTAFYNLPKETQPNTTAQALQEYLEHLTKGAEISNPDDIATLSLESILALFKQVGKLFVFIWDLIKTVSVYIWQLVVNYSLFLTSLTVLCLAGFFAFRSAKHPILTFLAKQRLKRLLNARPEQFLQQCYIELENYFARKGEPRLPGNTVQEYKQALCQRYRELDQHITEISHRFNLVCYSPYQVTPQDVQASFQHFISIVDGEKRPSLETGQSG